MQDYDPVNEEDGFGGTDPEAWLRLKRYLDEIGLFPLEENDYWADHRNEAEPNRFLAIDGDEVVVGSKFYADFASEEDADASSGSEAGWARLTGLAIEFESIPDTPTVIVDVFRRLKLSEWNEYDVAETMGAANAVAWLLHADMAVQAAVKK